MQRASQRMLVKKRGTEKTLSYKFLYFAVIVSKNRRKQVERVMVECVKYKINLHFPTFQIAFIYLIAFYEYCYSKFFPY